jgi:spermidine/putrescine transport system substrate-binding protein
MKFSFATGRPFAMDWIALQVIPSFHCTETVELVVRPESRHDSPDSRPDTRRLRAMPFTQPSTRRAFLRRAGLGAAGLAVGGPALLAACSKSAAPLRQVRVVNEPLAIDDNTPHLFESATGVFLRYREYTDPAAYLKGISARLRAHRDVGADVVVVPDLQAAQMIAAGWVRSLPSPPPASSIVPAFANPRFDPSRRFSLPWSSTVVGFAYDKRREPENVTSARTLFDPRLAGKVVLAADPAATLGLVMLASGEDPATVTAAQAEAAFQRVRAAVDSGQIRSLTTTSYTDDLVSGRAVLAIGRSDEIRIARQISPTLRFVVPSEGGLLESTNMVVPVGADDTVEGGVFIDYMFAPDPNSRVASFASAVTTVVGATSSLQSIDPKAALDPLVVPNPGVWTRLRVWGGTAATDAASAQLAALAATHAA